MNHQLELVNQKVEKRISEIQEHVVEIYTNCIEGHKKYVASKTSETLRCKFMDRIGRELITLQYVINSLNCYKYRLYARKYEFQQTKNDKDYKSFIEMCNNMCKYQKNVDDQLFKLNRMLGHYLHEVNMYLKLTSITESVPPAPLPNINTTLGDDLFI